MLFPFLLLLLAGRIAVPPTAESPPHTEIAKEVLDAPFWGDYVWLAEDRLLSWDRLDSPDETGWGTNYEGMSPRKYLPQILWLDGRSLMMYDFIKGQKRMPSLSRFAALSRDSKWVLWFSAPEYIGPTMWWEAGSLDQMQYLGVRFESPPRTYGLEIVQEVRHESFPDDMGDAVWRTDGQSWVMVRGTRQAPLYDLFSIRERRLVKEVKLPPVGLVPAAKHDFGPYLLGYTSGRTMLGFSESRLEH